VVDDAGRVLQEGQLGKLCIAGDRQLLAQGDEEGRLYALALVEHVRQAEHGLLAG
jgi:hypothetical protein